jgi:hypothetical protein
MRFPLFYQNSLNFTSLVDQIIDLIDHPLDYIGHSLEEVILDLELVFEKVYVSVKYFY